MTGKHTHLISTLLIFMPISRNTLIGKALTTCIHSFYTSLQFDDDVDHDW